MWSEYPLFLFLASDILGNLHLAEKSTLHSLLWPTFGTLVDEDKGLMTY